MEQNLYRQQALKKLSSPEKLNQMISITSARSWLALLAFGIIVAGALLWGFQGVLPHNVKGRGMLIQTGGVTEVAALSTGKIDQIPYTEGDRVEEGATIATIAQPKLEIKVNNAAKKLEELYEKYEKKAAFDQQDFKLRKELLLKKQTIQQSSIDANQERKNFVLQRINSQEQLLKEGLITEATLNNTKQLYFEIEQEIALNRNELKSINVDLFEMSERNETELNSLQEQILALEREIDELRAEYFLNSSIKSPYDGRVVEVLVNPGRVVNIGDIVLTLEVANRFNQLEAVIYMPPTDGKKIQEGMEVKVSPSTVEVEVFGYIEGRVKHVSEYPSSRAGMERILGNTDLANTFSGLEPPIAIIVELLPDTSTVSGYRWTSLDGPTTDIRSGTLCNAYITVEKQRPISLLFPTIKKEMKY